MGRQDGTVRQVTSGPVDDTGATILHVDMDAFFASVEQLRRPELRGKAVIVGGAGPRGVVAAASYEARRYGVFSAMPTATALQRAPHAIVVPGDYARYAEVSQQVMTILHEVTPLVEQLSIDEAFLDVAGARRLHGSPAEIGWLIRRRVRDETGLPCSVGAAATKFVAKVASGRAKPDGLLVIPPAETLAFLHPLPMRALWGVGRATEERLARLGLRTVGDVASCPASTLEHAVGFALAKTLSRLANGIDERSLDVERVEKSIGHESTFSFDLTDPDVIRRELLRLSDAVGTRLRRAGLLGRTVVLKLRYGDFRTVTRSRTLAEPTDVGRRIYEEVLLAYEAMREPGDRIRLLGVRAEQLGSTGASATLWDPDEDWREAERAIDDVENRFGKGAVKPATLIRAADRRVPG